MRRAHQRFHRANTFPIGYYTNFHDDGRRKAVPDLPVIGTLA